MKQYTECGVQTDSVVGDIAQPSPQARSRSSTQFDSAYSHTSELTDCSDVSGSAKTFTTAVRTLHGGISRGRPSGSNATLAYRVISLPETAPGYSAKLVHEKTKSRTVSMPLLGAFETDYTAATASVTNAEHRSACDTNKKACNQVQSLPSDMPYTPSPPSSPESVVIIANDDQLAEGFLRGPHPEAVHVSRSEDEGWITWSRSPPRPIPALHGPLSLPYARCPSGAEGTIIEEQENLPRMIWGLEGEDPPSMRSRPDSIRAPVNRKLQSHAGDTIVISPPPGLQRLDKEFDHSSASQLENLGPTRRRTTNVEQAIPGSRIQPRQNPRYPPSGQEPIDLSEIIRSQTETLSIPPHRTYNPSGGIDFSLPGQVMRFHNSLDDFGLHYQTIANVEGPKDAEFFSSALTSGGRAVTLQPTVSEPDVHSLGYLGASRSPVFQASSQLGLMSHACSPRRLSALEIAQQYRQQQLLLQQQQGSLLPTPPNSSSPIWSSAFSPYQGSTLSPELLSVVRLPRTSSALLQAPSDLVQHLPKSPRPSLDAFGTLSHKLGTVALAPAAHIGDISADNVLNVTRDVTSLPQYLRDQSYLSTVASHLSQVERSPLQPRPPPNTPLPSITAHEDTTGRSMPFSVIATPLSPTSPQARLRSFTHQQTRSIPLTRLIQRRLSSVPEEDASDPYDDTVRSRSFKVPRIRSQSSGNSNIQLVRSSHLSLQLDPLSSPSLDMSTLGPLRHQETVVEGKVDLQQPHPVVFGSKAIHAPRRSENVERGGMKKGDEARGRETWKEGTGRNTENARGRGHKKAPRGRRARGDGINRPERVDGGLVVKS